MIYPDYHQTTPLTPAQVKDAIRSASAQDAAILAIYSLGIARSPSQVHHMLERLGKRWPLTSIRRSITGLQKNGHLRKLDELRMGAYGKPEHLWERSADPRPCKGEV
jgi:hypothetical protein